MGEKSSQTDSISYPFNPLPPPGGTVEIRPGIYWVRLPVPYENMNHVNVWLLQDGDGWTLVDTGPSHLSTTTVWEQLFDSLLAGSPITRIISTHHHPDHVGLCTWMREHFDSEVWMTGTEYELLEGSLSSAHPQHAELVERFYKSHGLPSVPDWNLPDSLSEISTFPLGHSLQDNESFRIGNRQWQVIVTGGHTPEHFVLSCPEEKILIGGDLLLPTISSNVGVYPRLPDTDPLGDLLISMERLQGLPADTLVLPAHETPFLGLHPKLQRLRERYQSRLEKITLACATPRTANELLPEVFRGKLAGISLSLGMLEMVAYLNYLCGKAVLELTQDAEGFCRYQVCSSGNT